MADTLNTFFSTMFTREDTTNIPEPMGMVYGRNISTVKITTKKVREKILKLRPEAAAGPDKIGPGLLQELIDQIASPLGAGNSFQEDAGGWKCTRGLETSKCDPYLQKRLQGQPRKLSPGISNISQL